MRFRRQDYGALLAIVAGLFLIATTFWPPAPTQATAGEWSGIWTVGAYIIGAAFIAAPFIADRSLPLARVLLIGGGVILLGSAFLFGRVFGGGVYSAIFDLLPAILAIVAGWLVGPMRARRDLAGSRR